LPHALETKGWLQQENACTADLLRHYLGIMGKSKAIAKKLA